MMLKENIAGNGWERYGACHNSSSLIWRSWVSFVNVEVKWAREDKGLTDSVWGLDVCVIKTAVAEASKNVHIKMHQNVTLYILYLLL